MQNFDQIIIGAGLSGLVQAAILAQEGFKVCLLESSPIPGGYLQTFSRKGYKFDVGFHYMGSTNIDRPLYKLFKNIQIFDRLPICHYEGDFYQVVWNDHRFSIPPSFPEFIEKLQQTFPGEKEAIDRFYKIANSITTSFRWYDLQPEQSYAPPQSLSLPTYSIGQWLEENIHDEWLKRLLGAFSFHTGAGAYESPIVDYCLCLKSIFDRPVWLQSGGDGIVQPLYQRVKELGVDVRFQSPVTKIQCEEKKVQSVHTKKGETFCSPWVISTIHPKQTIQMIEGNALSRIFKDHILDMKESRGSFGVYLSLKKNLSTINPINYLYLVDNPLYEGFYFHSPSLLNRDQEKPRCSMFCFIDSKPFMEFRGSKRGNRPQAYLDLKQKYANALLGDIKKFIPEIEQNILDIYTSSPLTNEEYTGSIDGSAMGIAHNIEQQGIHRPQTFSRIKNLIFSGQSIYIPGICGVIINAFYSIANILGENYLFDKVTRKEHIL
ncbi:MAG: NAD(P)/FAD-dependent oxidoreductase [Candidatus Brocadiae bacterium]|nr:NAD(P)/FAD-dependent oxidoreductase [Candidatus Brocadiia bacterium]